ncbi:hypothetical protein MYX06_03110 [Patescibacteria group bacterium AH-259-L05]|nr:hypothetical protein [Patescibacteria group bacterium AH-259-L05]
MAEDLTVKQLRFAKWYLTYKKSLRYILISFLVVINVSLWALALYQFIFYISTTEAHEQMLKELTKERIDYLAMHKLFAPHDIVINKYMVVYNEGTGYDLVADIENSNQNWRVRQLAYYFMWSEGQSEEKTTFLLPNSNKLIFTFERNLDSKPNNLELIFSDVRWRRVREDRKLLEILPQIKVRDIALQYVVPEKELIALPKITWTVDNQSVYSFWQVNFVVVLYSGNKISGINVFPAKELIAGQEREVEFRWLNPPKSDAIEILLEINVFDSSMFMPAT